MYCKNCGQEINDDATFCPNCGTPCNANLNVQVNNSSDKPIKGKGIGILLGLLLGLIGLILALCLGDEDAKKGGLIGFLIDLGVSIVISIISFALLGAGVVSLLV